MRQYIVTKYLGPTNTRGSRVKAVASGSAPDHKMEITVGWNHRHGCDENHRLAAMALAKKLGWAGRWIAGGGNAGNIYVVDCDPHDGFTIDKQEA